MKPSATSSVISSAMDPSTEAFATKGIIVGGDVHREITEQTDNDLSFDDYTTERIINEVLCSIKSCLKHERTLIMKKRAFVILVEKEALFSVEKKRSAPSSSETCVHLLSAYLLYNFVQR